MAGGARGTGVAVIVALLAGVAAAGAHVATGSWAALAVALQAGAGLATHALVGLGGRRARRDAREDDPFGHGRERYFWPIVVGVVLHLAAGGGAVALGLRAADDPEALDTTTWAYGGLTAALVLRAVGLRAAARAGDEVRGRASWTAFVRRARAPELPVVLVEHLGALVATGAGLAGVAAAELADEPAADGIGAVGVGALAGLVALVLLAGIRSLLIGVPAGRRDAETITAAIEIDPAVRRLLSLRTHHQGAGELLVAARVELDHGLTFPEVCEVVSRIERNVRASVPMARATYIEPDVADERRAAPAVGEHVPGHDVPDAVRERIEAEARRGALGEHIPVEPDLEPPPGR